jgi:hypothetical protein
MQTEVRSMDGDALFQLNMAGYMMLSSTVYSAQLTIKHSKVYLLHLYLSMPCAGTSCEPRICKDVWS